MRNFFKKRHGGGDPPQAGDRTPEGGRGPRLVSPAPEGMPGAERTDAPRDVQKEPARELLPRGDEVQDEAEEAGFGGSASLAEAHEAESQMPRFSPVSGLRNEAKFGGLTAAANKQLRDAFTPTRPKLELNSLFVGRLNTLRRIIAAIEEERAHVVLYGDRGRGKTSLANAVQQIAGQAGYFTLKLTCSAELGFEDVFRSFLKRVPGSFYQAQVSDPFSMRRPPASFDELLPTGSFSVTQLTDVLTEIQGAHLLLILDEYDRCRSEELRNKLAELIKNLTDTSAPVSLLVVGVSEDVDNLLGKHPSIQRSLVAVHLPLMSDREIDRILLAGAEAAGLTFGEDVRQRIVTLAKGLPYYAQLLALHAARSAVGRDSREVEREDLGYAVARCVQEADRGLVENYNQALGPDAKPVQADVLYAAAQARADEFGVFHPAELARTPIGPNGETLPLAALQQPLSRLSDDEKGGILQRLVEPGGFRYRFRNQMMRQYVLMRQARTRGLT
ncbi:ATP-binding protein [Arenibaculum pallidiluteum]|uniref:ATP-binding protein n=1 Tax=Arenibaculum pallidiluteum TaxID=2812559 RepID=UPI001F26A520|nr:ATP-binding protein [Arenibaculum pallidiluteum]